MNKKNTLFWFRRDLRLQDNVGLYHALSESDSVACIFVFDKNILSELTKYNLQVDFLWNTLKKLKEELRSLGSDLIIEHDYPEIIIPNLAKKYNVSSVYCNEDYEPKTRQRDKIVAEYLNKEKIKFFSFKDQVIFSKNDVLTNSNQSFIVFSHYELAWKKKFNLEFIKEYKTNMFFDKFAKFKTKELFSLKDLGFEKTNVSEMKIGFSNNEAIKLFDNFCSKKIYQYTKLRDYPSVAGVSYLSVHNRFGTISIRYLLRESIVLKDLNKNAEENIDAWIKELIWREFYFQLLYHFPHLAYEPFNGEFIDFPWENDMEKFQKWCDGETGYPLIDAAMKQLNQTGYMHNRLRMVVASFLTKHLLIDYRLGEQYFSAKLIDYDLSANNGGWQWAASTGCDAQPYFRIFNPILQSEKFDPYGRFIKKMLPIFSLIDEKYIHNPSEYRKELQSLGITIGKEYPEPIINHKWARQRTLNLFKTYIANK